jgi:hypothetical protein
LQSADFETIKTGAELMLGGLAAKDLYGLATGKSGSKGDDSNSSSEFEGLNSADATRRSSVASARCRTRASKRSTLSTLRSDAALTNICPSRSRRADDVRG